MKRLFHAVVLVILMTGSSNAAGNPLWNPLTQWLLPNQVQETLPAPKLLSPTVPSYFLSQDRVVLSWAEVPDATGYILEVATFGYYLRIELTSTFYEIPPDTLLPQGYPWKVRALRGSEQSPWSDLWVFTVLSEAFTPTPTPSATPTPNVDFTGDGAITSEDTFLFLRDWYQESSAFDLDGDGEVTQSDLIIYLAIWKHRHVPVPTPLLLPPELLQPSEGARFDLMMISSDQPRAMTLDEQDSGVVFGWSSVSSADRYDLRFEGPSSGSLGEYVFRNLNATEVRVTLPLRRTETTDLGIYQWQVRSGSSTVNVWSDYSPPRSFEVVRYTPTPTPTLTPLPRSADINQDGRISADDLFLFASVWYYSTVQAGSLAHADLNRSGRIDADDLPLFLESRAQRREEALPMPLLLVPANGSVVTLDMLRPGGGFEWRFQAAPPAVLYQYELITPYGTTVSQYLQESGAGSYNLAERVSPFILGEWRWRVRSWGATGRTSPWSEQWRFRVEPAPTPTP